MKTVSLLLQIQKQVQATKLLLLAMFLSVSSVSFAQEQGASPGISHFIDNIEELLLGDDNSVDEAIAAAVEATEEGFPKTQEFVERVAKSLACPAPESYDAKDPVETNLEWYLKIPGLKKFRNDVILSGEIPSKDFIKKQLFAELAKYGFSSKDDSVEGVKTAFGNLKQFVNEYSQSAAEIADSVSVLKNEEEKAAEIKADLQGSRFTELTNFYDIWGQEPGKAGYSMEKRPESSFMKMYESIYKPGYNPLHNKACETAEVYTEEDKNKLYAFAKQAVELQPETLDTFSDKGDDIITRHVVQDLGTVDVAYVPPSEAPVVVAEATPAPASAPEVNADPAAASTQASTPEPVVKSEGLEVAEQQVEAQVNPQLTLGLKNLQNVDENADDSMEVIEDIFSTGINQRLAIDSIELHATNRDKAFKDMAIARAEIKKIEEEEAKFKRKIEIDENYQSKIGKKYAQNRFDSFKERKREQRAQLHSLKTQAGEHQALQNLEKESLKQITANLDRVSSTFFADVQSVGDYESLSARVKADVKSVFELYQLRAKREQLNETYNLVTANALHLNETLKNEAFEEMFKPVGALSMSNKVEDKDIETRRLALEKASKEYQDTVRAKTRAELASLKMQIANLGAEQRDAVEKMNFELKANQANLKTYEKRYQDLRAKRESIAEKAVEGDFNSIPSIESVRNMIKQERTALFWRNYHIQKIHEIEKALGLDLPTTNASN